MMVKIGDSVRCNPEEPEDCNKSGQTGTVVSTLEVSGGSHYGSVLNVKVKFDDGVFLFFFPSELEVVGE